MIMARNISIHITLLVLFFAVLMVLQNADLGGRMVFVEGAAVKALPSEAETPNPQEHHHHHHEEEE